jgi:hypothetical protein
MIFRDPPSAALKVTVFAAVLSYVAVAFMHVDSCFSQYAACILITPAVLVYWAPAFAGAWLAIAVLLKAVNPRQRVLPSLRLTESRETPYLRSKGQAAFAAMVAAAFYLSLEYVTRGLASRLTGDARAVAASAHDFLQTRLGVALVVGLVFALSIIVLRRVQGPVPDDWNQLR